MSTMPTLYAIASIVLAFLAGYKFGARRQLNRIAWAQHRTPGEVQSDYRWRKREEEVLG